MMERRKNLNDKFGFVEIMEVSLNEIGEIITGNTPSKSDTNFWNSPDICFIKPDVIAEDEITELLDSNEYISENARNKARIVNENSILVTCIGSIAKIGIVKIRECAFNQQINAIIPNKNIDTKYLCYCLQNSKVKLKAIANAPVVPIINKKQFGEFVVKIDGDISTQKKIVNRLDYIQSVITLYKIQLQKFDDLIKARFIEMFGDGNLPMKTVEELCSCVVDCPHTTPKYEGDLKNPAIRTSEIKKGFLVWDTMRYVSDKEYVERTTRAIPKAGDIVYGREGTFGNAAILPDGYKFCLGQRVMLLRPAYSKCTSEYLLHSVISDEVYRQAIEKNNASTVAHVNVKDVKQFKVPLPSLDKQNEFANFVKQVDKSREAVKKSLEKTQQLYDSLMQEYFG